MVGDTASQNGRPSPWYDLPYEHLANLFCILRKRLGSKASVWYTKVSRHHITQ